MLGHRFVTICFNQLLLLLLLLPLLLPLPLRPLPLLLRQRLHLVLHLPAQVMCHSGRISTYLTTCALLVNARKPFNLSSQWINFYHCPISSVVRPLRYLIVTISKESQLRNSSSWASLCPLPFLCECFRIRLCPTNQGPTFCRNEFDPSKQKKEEKLFIRTLNQR